MESLRDRTTSLVVSQGLTRYAPGPQLFVLYVIFFFQAMWPTCILACLIQSGVGFLIFVIKSIVIYI